MKKNEARRFWNWQGDADGRELYLYGTIAPESWYEHDVTPEMFRSELMSGTGPITVWLSSPGGDCVAASQIYTMLMDYPFDVTVKIDGIAASAASVIAMAGTKVLMAPTACLMIHDPMTAAIGSTAEMEKAIEMLDAVKESIINAYQIKTGLDRKALARMMSEETWMDCNKAIELGFADGVLEPSPHPVNKTVQSFFFSQKAVDAALVNKLIEHPVGPLYERLEQLKPPLALNPLENIKGF